MKSCRKLDGSPIFEYRGALKDALEQFLWQRFFRRFPPQDASPATEEKLPFQSPVWETSLQRMSLAHAELTAFSPFKEDWSFSDFCYANLSESLLSESVFFGCHFFGADLSNARLAGTDLREADLGAVGTSHGANLAGADLRGARLEETRLTGVLFDAGTRFPEKLSVDQYSVYGRKKEYFRLEKFHLE